MGKESVSKRAREAQLYPKSAGTTVLNEDQIVAAQAFSWEYSTDKKTVYINTKDGYELKLSTLSIIDKLTVGGDLAVTGDTTFGGDVIIGDASSFFETGSGVTANSYFGRNVYYDGSNFRRLIADNNVLLMAHGENGAIQFWRNTDANATADSIITLSKTFEIDSSGDAEFFGDIRTIGDGNIFQANTSFGISRNAYYDGGYKRLINDNDAQLLAMSTDKKIQFYQNSDANTAAGSTITWSKRFEIDAAGDATFFGEVRTLGYGNIFERSTGNLAIGRNCYYNGGYKRLVADNDAQMLYMSDNGYIQFYQNSDANTAAGSTITWSKRFEIDAAGDVNITGALSKGSGSFKIDHPLKPDTHNLIHSFVEAPGADLFYSGMAQLENGTVEIDIDESAGMTPGTFEVLCRELRRFTTNETGFTRIRSELIGSKLTVIAEDETCTDEVFWMVIGERQDKHMYDTAWTDADGKVIVEKEKDLSADINQLEELYEERHEEEIDLGRET